MDAEEFFEQIDPELFDLAVVIEYRTPLARVRNVDSGNQVWLRIRALAGEENARVGVELVNVAREQSQRSLGQQLHVLNPERSVNSAQTPPTRIQEPANLPSNVTQSITHAASSGNSNPTGSVPRRRRFYEENPPIDLDRPIWEQPNSSVGHALPTSNRAHNLMQQTYRRFRNFVRTITRRRRI
jgi:hypothetical protein